MLTVASSLQTPNRRLSDPSSRDLPDNRPFEMRRQLVGGEIGPFTRKR